jgi:FtsP/CotA-like multicopper oxidase with cupredoxin domain
MTIFKKFRSIPGIALLALLLAVPAFAANVPVSLVAEQVTATMPDGALVPIWGLRDSVANPTAGTATIPGPTIRAVAGDNLIITLTNNLPEPTSLVINGQKATEAGAMTPTWDVGTPGNRSNLTQRVRSFTHEAASGGGSDTYRWDGLKPGTYLVESGSHQAVQIPMGLYAVLVVDEAANAQAYPDASTAYTGDAVLVFSEVDPLLNAAVAGGTYGTPAYTTSMGEGYLPRYFLINGSSYAAGSAVPIDLGAAAGDKLLRFVNAGSRTRNPVLQGPYMTLIAEDGFPYNYQLQQYVLYLTAGKTIDALFTPTAEGTLALYDRSLGLTNDMTSPGGMIASLNISSIVLPPDRVGVFRPIRWFLDANGNGAWDAGIDTTYPDFGLAGDTPVTGDWNADGTTEVGIFRAGRWVLDANGNGAWDSGIDTVYSSFGLATDIPVTGDWNGNGTTQIGVFRNGRWYLDANGNGVWDAGIDTLYTNFGIAGDIPVTGDWNGNGTTQIGVFRNGRWLLDANGNGAWDPGIDTDYSSFGLATDTPVTGDWSGNGISKIGVFRNGRWYLDANGNGVWNVGVDTLYTNFGSAGDLPISGNW